MHYCVMIGLMLHLRLTKYADSATLMLTLVLDLNKVATNNSVMWCSVLIPRLSTKQGGKSGRFAHVHDIGV